VNAATKKAQSMRRATQFDRFLDGQWHELRPGVDATALTINGVASAFRSAARYRGFFPFVVWNVDRGTASVLAASAEQAEAIRSGQVTAAPKPTLDDYLRNYHKLSSAERAEMTGQILAASRS
jgi:hypothetical protein